MATCNPFNAGDKVKIKEDPYGIFSRAGLKLNTIYTVRQVEFDRLYLKETLGRIHYTHFELYKEEKDMTSQATQQTEPKTKRVPFTHELWEKWKDKGVVVTTLNGRVLEQFTCFNLRDVRVYAGVYDTEATPLVYNYYSNHLFLEIPVTTKRIPFNPELKDAKVVCKRTSDELSEWVYMTSSVVCGVIKHEGGGYTTKIYHPNTLEMEIEEDV